MHPYTISRGKVIFDYSALYCETPEKLLRSELFMEVVDRFVERIASRGSSVFAFLVETLPHGTAHGYPGSPVCRGAVQGA